jgi:hypothetical protein
LKEKNPIWNFTPVDYCFACRLGGALLLQLCSAGAGAGAVEAKSWVHHRYGFRTHIFKNKIQVALGVFLAIDCLSSLQIWCEEESLSSSRRRRRRKKKS